MVDSSELLERAWRQLELENPEYTSRLRKLKEKQGKNMKTELCHASPLSSHVQQVFEELTSSEFASVNGDITLVFKDNERIHFYKSILSLIKHEWNLLLQLFSRNTEVVILPDTSWQEFWGEITEKRDDLTASCPVFKKAFEGNNFDDIDHVCSLLSFQCTSCLKKY